MKEYKAKIESSLMKSLDILDKQLDNDKLSISTVEAIRTLSNIRDSIIDQEMTLKELEKINN